MSSPLHREIDAPRYRVVVDGRPAYRAESPSEIEGYVARATITRLDGSPVSKALRMNRSPRHLLPLHKTLADHLVDSRLHEARGDWLAMTVAAPKRTASWRSPAAVRC